MSKLRKVVKKISQDHYCGKELATVSEYIDLQSSENHTYLTGDDYSVG